MHRHLTCLLTALVLCLAFGCEQKSGAVGQAESEPSFDGQRVSVTLGPVEMLPGSVVVERLEASVSGAARVRMRGSTSQTTDAASRYESETVLRIGQDDVAVEYVRARWQDEVNGELVSADAETLEGATFEASVEPGWHFGPPARMGRGPISERERVAVVADLDDMVREYRMIEAIAAASPLEPDEQIELPDSLRVVPLEGVTVRLRSLVYLGVRNEMAVLEFTGDAIEETAGTPIGTFEGEVELLIPRGWPARVAGTGKLLVDDDAEGRASLDVERTYRWPAPD